MAARDTAGPNLAVALRYDPRRGMAPQVKAKGQGALAAQIVAIAKANQVTVERDPNLASLLSTVEVDCPIPAVAFAAVAEILGQLYRANQRLLQGAP